MSTYSSYGIQKTNRTASKKPWYKRILILLILGIVALIWFTLEYTYDRTSPLFSFSDQEISTVQTTNILQNSENPANKKIVANEITPEKNIETIIQPSVKNGLPTESNLNKIETNSIILNTEPASEVSTANETIPVENKPLVANNTTSDSEPASTDNAPVMPVEVTPQAVTNIISTTDTISTTDNATDTDETITFPDQTSLSVSTSELNYKIFSDINTENTAIKKTPHILDKISFLKNATNVSEESQAQLKKIAFILNKFPHKNILIRGHTDSIGKRYVNKYVSLHRAQSVRNAFVQLGVDKSRIKIKAMGERTPLVPNTSKANRMVNRRIDITILN